MAFKLMDLTQEMCMEVILQLQPRHVYKLMQTNKRFYWQCRSEAYWARVAAYLAWGRTEFLDPLDTVLLRKSYRATVDEYIKYVRDDMRTSSPPYCNNADLPLAKFALLGEEVLREQEDRGTNLFTPSTNTFSLVKRIVEDTDYLKRSIQRATEGWDVPRRAGFITGSRRAARATNTFLRSLEDDQGMDLDAKIRVREYADQLFRNICASRGRCVRNPNNGIPVTFELHEADIDTMDIFLLRTDTFTAH